VKYKTQKGDIHSCFIGHCEIHLDSPFHSLTQSWAPFTHPLDHYI